MTKLPSSSKLRQVIANFSAKERAFFVAGIILIIIGVFGGIVALSNKWTARVPLFGGTYHEGIIGSPRFINPVLANSDADNDLVALVYSGLVRLDHDGTVIADLASSWEISPDGKMYTVVLKPGLRFHDQKPLTADDVVFTVQKIQDPTLKSPARVAWDGVLATASDPNTVVFALQKPYAGFLSQLTLGILPKHLWGNIPDNAWQTSEFNTEPIGSGPYKLKEVSRSRIGIPQNYELKAFKKFALGKPFIKNFVIVCLANKSDAYDALRGGDIDGLSMVNSGDIASIKNGRQNIVTKPLPRVFGIFFNPIKNKNFADPAVIRALNLALDKKSIIEGVFGGYATPLGGPLPESTDVDTSDYATKQALAQKTLDANGWKVNSKTGIREKMLGKQLTPLSFSLSTANTPELSESAQLIRDQYAEIGVQIEVKIFEIGTLNENVIRARDFEALLFGQVIRHDTDIFAFWDSSQKADPGLNITSYTNKSVDGLLEKAIKEPDQAKRFAIYQTITQQLAKDAPVAFLYAPDFIYMMDDKVGGVAIPPISKSSDRFSLVHRWYVNTDQVWNGFTKK